MKKSFKVSRIDVVKSSNIKLVAFHNDTTFVQFKNDSMYSYKGTKKEDYEALIKAKSVGAHLNSAIKGNFEYEKVDYELNVFVPQTVTPKQMSDDELVKFINDCFDIHLHYEDLTVDEIVSRIKKGSGSNNGSLIALEVKKHRKLTR